MSTRARRQPTKAPPKKATPPKKTTPKPGGKQFGTSSTDSESHVHVPPEMMQDHDLYGNEFMKTMLA